MHYSDYSGKITSQYCSYTIQKRALIYKQTQNIEGSQTCQLIMSSFKGYSAFSMQRIGMHDLRLLVLEEV